MIYAHIIKKDGIIHTVRAYDVERMELALRGFSGELLIIEGYRHGNIIYI